MPQHCFVLGGELALVLVRELDEAEISTVTASERRRQPPAHGRPPARFPAEPLPARMSFKLGLRQAHWPLLLAHERIDA